MLNAASGDEPERLRRDDYMALFSVPEQTHCSLVVRHSGWVTEADVFVVDANQSGGHSLLPKVRSDSLSSSQSDGWVAGWLSTDKKTVLTVLPFATTN